MNGVPCWPVCKPTRTTLSSIRSASRKSARKYSIFPSLAPFPAGKSWFERTKKNREFRTLADLKGKKLGLGQGTNFGDLAKAVGGIDGKTYPGSPEYLQDLALGRIDAALNDSLLIPYVVKQTRLPLKAGTPVGELERSGIPFARGTPQFKVAIDKALADIKADGSSARISMKWFERDVSKPPVAVKQTASRLRLS